MRVNPVVGIRVIVAVYAVLCAKAPETVGVHVTVPVYCAVGVIVVTGVAPATGGVTPGTAAIFICALAVNIIALAGLIGEALRFAVSFSLAWNV